MRIFSDIYMGAFLPGLHPDTYGGLRSRWRRYEEREQMTLARNRELQWQAVVAMLQHAHDTTPYYRRMFESAGIRVADIQTPSDLQKLPVLTKQDIQRGFDDLWSRKYRREELLGAATGGTTDTPVPLLRDAECARERMAVRLRFNAWASLYPGDKVFWLWGARTDFPVAPSWRWRLYDRYLMRRHWAPTSLLNEQVLEQYAQELERFQPKAIIAYPTPLSLFAEYLLGRKGGYFRPASVISTAEPLTPDQRTVIDRAFGSVFDHYGSRDFGMIAAECEQHAGLHVNPAAVFLEYAPLSSGSEVREVLVTDLLNHGMPMIRYRVNDCASEYAEPCACGRGYPQMQSLEGRTTDNFYLANGDVVPGVAFTNRLIKVCPGIRKMQLIQEDYTRFRIRYVPSSELREEDLSQVRSKFSDFVGSQVDISFEEVAEIGREASGKTRFAISHVRPGRQMEPSGGSR